MKITHGRSKTNFYATWFAMRNRCQNPKHRQYNDYGGRGITVCDRWNKFQNFLADMGERPSGMTIERIDNDKGYCPENCRWATYKEQRANQRTKRIDQFSFIQLADELGKRMKETFGGELMLSI